MRLLLVEDERDLADLTARGLRHSGYAVDVACDGEEAIWYYEVNEYDLIVLDLNLPKIDGIDVLRTIRETDSAIKIIILSARSRVDERVLGLDTGANDYLVKPFDFKELEARIRTLIRREFVQRSAVLRCGGLEMDTAARTACFKETELNLTKKEYGVLEYLCHHKDAVVSAEELVEHVWDNDADPFSNSLKYHIHCLKKKLDQAGADGGFLTNFRGQGYRLMEDKHEVDE